MLTCPETQDALSARQDGELPPTHREAVDHHLATCAPCRAVAQDLTDLDRYLLQSPPIPTDPSLAARLTAQLFVPPVRALPPPRPSWGLRAAALVTLLAAAALLAPADAPPPLAVVPSPPADPETRLLQDELAATARDLAQLRADLTTFHTRATAEASRTDRAIASKQPEPSK